MAGCRKTPLYHGFVAFFVLDRTAVGLAMYVQRRTTTSALPEVLEHCVRRHCRHFS